MKLKFKLYWRVVLFLATAAGPALGQFEVTPEPFAHNQSNSLSG